MSDFSTVLEGLSGTNQRGFPPGHHVGNWGFGVDSAWCMQFVKAELWSCSLLALTQLVLFQQAHSCAKAVCFPLLDARYFPGVKLNQTGCAAIPLILSGERFVM